ncbi:MAG: hypothetical protein K6F52_04620 [Clostridia bacterium]|nr:hypothetical protein [Clostridia bacterium]
MAGFFDKVTDIAKTAADKGADLAKTAADKGAVMVEVTKLNSKLRAEETAMNDTYAAIGKMYYAKYANGAEVDENAVTELCKKIDASAEVIEKLHEDIEAAKNS